MQNKVYLIKKLVETKRIELSSGGVFSLSFVCFRYLSLHFEYQKQDNIVNERIRQTTKEDESVKKTMVLIFVLPY